MNYCVLYNPLANNGKGEEAARLLSVLLPTDNCDFQDITAVEDYRGFFATLPEETGVVICGGDGTLNRFVNDVRGIRIRHPLFYYPIGSGNDFARDVGIRESLISINEYIRFLPTVTVNGQERLVLNGVGFGIDGYCCEVGDKIRATQPNKEINYGAIAVKGLLFHYKPTKAIVTVDGKKHYYKKVWIAPTMNGRYYGGGMMPTPKQDRNHPQGKISVMIFHGCGKLKTLCIFPSLFKGEHVRKKKHVEILSGHSITVEFDQPRSVQIDGETVLNVKSYHVKSAYGRAQERRRRMGGGSAAPKR